MTVYPSVTHMLVQMACGQVMYTHAACNYHNHTCRNWQKNLHCLVHDSIHKAEIYKYLWILITEPDQAVFSDKMNAFIQFWKTKEPQFISYFQDYYAN